MSDRQKLQTAAQLHFVYWPGLYNPAKPSRVLCNCVNKLYLRKFALQKRGTLQLAVACSVEEGLSGSRVELSVAQ